MASRFIHMEARLSTVAMQTLLYHIGLKYFVSSNKSNNTESLLSKVKSTIYRTTQGSPMSLHRSQLICSFSFIRVTFPPPVAPVIHSCFKLKRLASHQTMTHSPRLRHSAHAHVCHPVAFFTRSRLTNQPAASFQYFQCRCGHCCVYC